MATKDVKMCLQARSARGDGRYEMTEDENLIIDERQAQRALALMAIFGAYALIIVGWRLHDWTDVGLGLVVPLVVGTAIAQEDVKDDIARLLSRRRIGPFAQLGRTLLLLAIYFVPVYFFLSPETSRAVGLTTGAAVITLAFDRSGIVKWLITKMTPVPWPEDRPRN
jgi:hypothetical protein